MFLIENYDLSSTRTISSLTELNLQESIAFKENFIKQLKEGLDLHESKFNKKELDFVRFELGYDHKDIDHYVKGSIFELDRGFFFTVSVERDTEKIEAYRTYITNVIKNIKTEEDRKEAIKYLDLQSRAIRQFINENKGKGNLFSPISMLYTIKAVFDKVVRAGFFTSLGVVGTYFLTAKNVIMTSAALKVAGIATLVWSIFQIFNIGKENQLRTDRIKHLLKVIEDTKVLINKIKLPKKS